MKDLLRALNPMQFVRRRSGTSYQKVPVVEAPSSSSQGLLGQPPVTRTPRWPSSPIRFSPTRIVWLVVAALTALVLLIGGLRHRQRVREAEANNEPAPFFWQYYPRLNGYYNGIRTLVPYADYTPVNGYNKTDPRTLMTALEAASLEHAPPLQPVIYDPYPSYASSEYTRNHAKVHRCYLDSAKKIPALDTYAYPGLPQNMSEPQFGSYSLLGLEEKMCHDRFSRFGPYGYGVAMSDGGLGPGNKSEKVGSEAIFDRIGPPIDFDKVDWGSAQDDCFTRNKARFEETKSGKNERVKRHAYVLRIWGDFYFNEHIIYTLRAMINELSLKSGGEYDVHFLLHVKNNSIPIWADKEVHDSFIRENMPREFWNMTTLWSELAMVNYYPEPFGEAFQNMAGSGIHGVYRSAHFALQWFAQNHPDYDFYWNWEMDMRYIGNYYEFNTAVGEWAKQQPRKGLWERNERFYIPGVHGSWENFTQLVEAEMAADSDRTPIWGPLSFDGGEYIPEMADMAPMKPPTSYEEDKYQWGVGEEADFIAFNPIFDPTKTNWVFRMDISGYSHEKEQPPTRCAIVTVARLSKRLLSIMHEETWKMRHSMFPEMWPPSVCLHYGLKAVYAPHPVYFDRDWDLEYMDKTFNHPAEYWESPFGWGEHNLLGSSFYYNSGFSGALWRRWLGQMENGEGGGKSEMEGSGRMCLRSSLHHPVKHESGSMD